MKLQGSRIYLSEVTDNDLGFISELECNHMVWKYEEFVENDKEAAKNKYLSQIGSKHHYDFIVKIESDEGDIPIGIVQVWSYVEHRNSWELGFGMLPEYQSNGYGYEAVKLLLQFSFKQLNARKIVAMCNSQNLKSINLMEKLNMNREGIFKEELKWNGEYCNQFFYSILQREWFADNLNE